MSAAHVWDGESVGCKDGPRYGGGCLDAYFCYNCVDVGNILLPYFSASVPPILMRGLVLEATAV